MDLLIIGAAAVKDAGEGENSVFMMRKTISVIVMALSLIILLGCGVIYCIWYRDWKNSVGVMENLKASYVTGNIFQTEKSKDIYSTDTTNKMTEFNNTADENTMGEKPDFDVLKIDWKGLKSQNEDIIAWIDVPGTEISYPIVQTGNDEYYLNHTITREANSYGAIFLSSLNKNDFTDSHSIIYGHNMNDGTMFAGINKYKDRSVYETSPYIHIYLPGQVTVYKVFSSFQASIGGISFLLDLKLESREYYEQLSVIKAASDYDTETKIINTQPFITLMTCNSWGNSDDRTSLHGIRQNQYYVK